MKVNRLVLCKDDYKDEIEFESEIKNAIMLLLNAGYIMTVNYDDKSLGIVIIEYNYADKEYGNRYPVWLLPEEEDSIIWEDN